MCVSRMNGATRKKKYKIIAGGSGEFCKMCGVSGQERQLVIDHIDNDNSNNELSNLQLLCRPCNYRKNPRPVDVCEREKEQPEPLSEIEINRTKEPQFKTYLAQRINEAETVPEHDIVYSSAEVCGVSPTTTKRYLLKCCSTEGIYKRTMLGDTWYIKFKDELPFR